jgi:DNA-binding transcriptional ArsR family regulator
MERKKEFGRSDINGATIRSTSKRRTAMKILIYLKRENDWEGMPLSIGDISEGLDIAWETTSYNLTKLVECGFIAKVEDKMDARTRYFQVVNKEATGKAIKLYKRMVGFRLGRLIPYNKVYSEQLKSDKRFVEMCKVYGLTLYEGISAVAACPKIGTQTVTDYSGRSNGLFLWRKEPGYIPPEKEKTKEPSNVEEEKTESEENDFGVIEV